VRSRIPPEFALPAVAAILAALVFAGFRGGAPIAFIMIICAFAFAALGSVVDA
jgi:hypothetical protein